MPYIEFPDIPPYPGVPQLNRLPYVSTILGTIELHIASPFDIIAQKTAAAVAQANVTIGGITSPVNQWGIFDAVTHKQLGLTPDSTATIACYSLEYERESRVADFPVEASATSSAGAPFATYNKAIMPATPVIVCIIEGEEIDRTTFLGFIEAACISTELYNIVTPTVTYMNYTVTQYSYARKAEKGAVLLSVEVRLKEVRQVVAASTMQPGPIQNPIKGSATPPVDNGSTSPATVPPAVLRGLGNKPETAPAVPEGS